MMTMRSNLQGAAKAAALASLPHSTRRQVLTGLTLGVSALLLTSCGRGRQLTQPTASGGEHKNLRRHGDIIKALTNLEEEHGITLSLAAYDHAQQQLFLYRGDQWSYEASISKVPISLTLLRLAAFQLRELTATEKALIEASVTYSDNASTSEIFRITGTMGQDGADSAASAESLNQTYRLLGASTTRSAGTWGDNRTWAQDQVEIMKSLVDAVDWVNPADAQYLLERMVPFDASQLWGVGSQQGKTVQGEPVLEVAVKNGWIQDKAGLWNINSVGAVRTASTTYSICLLSRDFQDQETGYQVASQAVQAYFDYLD